MRCSKALLVLVVVAGSLTAACGGVHRQTGPNKPASTLPVPTSAAPTTGPSISPRGIRLVTGRYGFLVPQGWTESPLRNYGGPASFGSFTQPSDGAGRIDYEKDGTGSVYGPDHNPQMQSLTAALSTTE